MPDVYTNAYDLTLVHNAIHTGAHNCTHNSTHTCARTTTPPQSQDPSETIEVIDLVTSSDCDSDMGIVSSEKNSVVVAAQSNEKVSIVPYICGEFTFYNAASILATDGH